MSGSASSSCSIRNQSFSRTPSLPISPPSIINSNISQYLSKAYPTSSSSSSSQLLTEFVYWRRGSSLAMASTSSSTLTISSSSSLVDAKAPRQSASASSQCVSLPSLPPPPVHSQNRPWKATAYCRKIARNVMAMAMASSATGEAPPAIVTGQEISTEVVTAEPPEIIKKIQQAWDKVEDKYAVSTVAAAGVVALWGTAGMMSAIDRLPLIPGMLEFVGIGYTGWFAYKNLVFKPDREAFVRKVKETYYEITGSSSS